MDLKNILVAAKNDKYPKELVDISSGQQEMIIFVGFPGCGKSTLYRRFFAVNNFKHINRDTLNSMEKCVAQCKRYIQQKHSVVIDNTNPSMMARKRFIQIANMHNVKIRCVWIQIDMQLSYHLNVIRWKQKQKDKLPIMAYKKFEKEFNAPQQIEGFQSIIKVPFVFDDQLIDENEFLLHT